MSLQLGEIKRNYLYQSRPDIFPEGFLTLTEMELWGLYYKEKNG